MGSLTRQGPTFDDIIRAFDDATEAGIEVGTALVTAERKDMVWSLARLLHGWRSGSLCRAFVAEFKSWRERGRVKDDYAFTEQFQVCLQELLDAIDNDSLDEDRFNVLKKILMVACSEGEVDRDSVLPT